MRALLCLLLVSACTLPPPNTQTGGTGWSAAHAHKDTVGYKDNAVGFEGTVVAARHQPVVHHQYHPLNCGTPDEFKICPLPLRAPIYSEELDPLETTLDDDNLPAVIVTSHSTD